MSCSQTWSEGWGNSRSEAGGPMLLPAFLGVSRALLSQLQAPLLEKGLQHP